MSELQKVIEQIEELRINLIKIKMGKAFTDPEVVEASQILDAALNKYQVLLMKQKQKQK